jgi:RNA-directed DNA polymerase
MAAKSGTQKKGSKMEQLTLGLEKPDTTRLFDEVSALPILKLAFKKVKSNRGKPGPDGQTVEAFASNEDANLEELRAELIDWTYRPGAVRRVVIPKPDGGERLLGVPNVRDRIVQQAMKVILSGLYEPAFSDHSHGFRPGRSQRTALEEAQGYVREGKEWVVDLDLERFFDTVNHDRLIHLLRQRVEDKRIIRLVGMTLRSGVWTEGVVEQQQEGQPQGSPLSPLLSNIILSELDEELEKRGLRFVRYADDANIFVGSEKAAKRVLEKVTKFIEKELKLKVNRTKSQVALSRGVKFLGMTILTGGVMIISAGAMSRAKAKLRELVPRGGRGPLEAQIDAVNKWYRGWVGYYAMGEYPSQLKVIEARARARFRLQFVKNHKRKKHLLRKLCDRGMRKGTAFREVYTKNHGRWRLAHTMSVNQAWSIYWFNDQGLLTFSQEQRPHWRDFKAYPSLL